MDVAISQAKRQPYQLKSTIWQSQQKDYKGVALMYLGDNIRLIIDFLVRTFFVWMNLDLLRNTLQRKKTVTAIYLTDVHKCV